MKIAYIALKGISTAGGVEKYTLELGSRLAKRGHEILAYVSRNNGENLPDSINGIKIKTLPSLKTKSLEKMSISFLASLDQLITNNIDIVHYHAFGPAMLSFIPKMRKKKIVMQGHGIEWMRAKWGWMGKSFFKITELPSVWFADIVTVVSVTQKEYLKRNYNIDSVYIPPGIRYPTHRIPSEIREFGLKGNDYILFASRLVPEKGAHYLIEAYNKIKTDKKLVLVGDAKYEDAYKRHLKELAKRNNSNVIFTGYVSNEVLEEFYSNAYVFVLPSEIEGLPAALLEAMSYGNCCLVSDIPENLEALNDIGFSFENKSTDSLADMLKYLLENQGEVRKVKETSITYALKTYSWDNITDKIEILYRKLL